MTRILSFSYDKSLLETRQMLLESRGYEVVSLLRFKDAIDRCKKGGFDLFLLGHSIPQEDKKKLVSVFREHCYGPIISLRLMGDQLVDGADYHIEADPEPLLRLINKVLANNC